MEELAASGVPSNQESSCGVEHALGLVFGSILAQLAETDIFGKSDSQSIFIVYAHENQEAGTASAWCVSRLIDWLKAIRSRTISDQEPIPLWASRTGGFDSVRNILSSQLCLLPQSKPSNDDGVIHRVDRVVVCGSEVLRTYYRDPFTSTYIDTIVTTFVEGEKARMPIRDIEEGIRGVVEENCCHPQFHHVLTEIAFLKLRSLYKEDSQWITQVALDQDLMEWLPFLGSCDLVLKLKSLDEAGLHQLFFKFLGQIYAEEHVLINRYKECYSQASKKLETTPELTGSKVRQIIDQEISTAQRDLRMVENADIRSRRNVLNGFDRNEFHRSMKDSLHDMGGMVKSLVDDSASRLSADIFQHALEWLSTCPFHLHHESVSRKLLVNSGTWITDHSSYRNWLQSESSSILLIHGVRGCGKSSMFSVIVNQLLSERPGNRRTPAVAYFYCSNTPSEPDRASPAAILRSVLRQLAMNPEDQTIAPTVLSEFERRAGSPKSQTSWIQLGEHDCRDLIRGLAASGEVFIALDAIDELGSEDRQELIEALKHIANESPGQVKVVLTSRDDAQIEGLLGSAAAIRISSKDNAHDVAKFVGKQLDSALRGRRLLGGNPSSHLLERLRQSLVTGAGEMFLWVELQLQVLCRKKTENDIMAALDAGLSDNLDKIYATVYQSILALDPTAKSIVQGLLALVLYARTPLTMDALRSALVQNPQVADQLRGSALPSDLVDVCYNLVVLDSAMNVLRLCHPSAGDYMRKQEMFSEVDSNRLLAVSCLQQCSGGWSDPPEQLLSLDSIDDFFLYAALYWPEHTKFAELHGAGISTVEAMTRFVFDEDGDGLDMSFILWLEWIQQALKQLPAFHALRSTHEFIISLDEASPIFTACVFGLCGLLDLTFSSFGRIDLEQRRSTGRTALYLACSFGHEAIVSQLLSRGADANVICGSYGNPMQVACFRGHLNVVKTLLDRGVSPDVSTTEFKNGLHAACEGARPDVAELLVKQSSMITNGGDYDDALQFVVEAGFLDTVEYLLRTEIARKYGRDVENTEKAKSLALGAIKRGQVDRLRCLLRSKPEMKTSLPQNAIAIAALHGHTDMLDFLHSLGMDIEAEGDFGSPLRSASLKGHMNIVEELLKWGADVKKQGPRGDALQAATRKGHVHIMKLLILAKADVNQEYQSHGTCIQTAAYYGHEEAIKLLIDEGASIFTKSAKFSDALHAAVRGGHLGIASFLQGNFLVPGRLCIRAVPCAATFGRRRYSQYHFLGKRSHHIQSKPHSEEIDDGSDEESTASRDQGPRYKSPRFDSLKYGVTFAAAIGNIPRIRQELRTPGIHDDDIEEALEAAAREENLQALKILLEEGLRLTSFPRLSVESALVSAVEHQKSESLRILADYLGGVVTTKEWASALKQATKTGDERMVRQILALSRLEISTSSIYRWRYKHLTETAVPACKKAIETAVSFNHQEVARMLLDWVLSQQPEFLGAQYSDWVKLSAVAAKLADVRVLDSCLAMERLCPDYPTGPQSHRSLLLNAVLGQNSSTLSFILEKMHQMAYDTTEIVAPFMEACRQGFAEGALQLSSRKMPLALPTSETARGIVVTSASGHGGLAIDLIRNLRCHESDEPRIMAVISDALLSASGAGKLKVIQQLLNTTDIRKHVNYKTIITRVLITACEFGRTDVAALCLNENADPEMAVPKAAPDVVPRLSYPMPRLTYPGDINPRQIGQTTLAIASSHSWETEVGPLEASVISVESQIDALDASVRSLFQLSKAEIGLPDNALYQPPSTQELPQCRIVDLILEHVGDLSNRDSEDDSHPLRTAVQSGTYQAVRSLVKHGAADNFSSEQLADLMKEASRRPRGISIEIVLQLLKLDRGNSLPTAADGSLGPVILKAIGTATKLLYGKSSGTASLRATYGQLKELVLMLLCQFPHQDAGNNVFGDFLCAAAAAGDVPTVEQLIRHDVDVNYTRDFFPSPLGAAAKFDQLQVMRTLIRAGAVVSTKRETHYPGDKAPAHTAIENNQAAALELLLNEGANPNLNVGETPVKDSLLRLAVREGTPAMLKLLFQAGADPNSDPLAFMMAASAGKLDMCVAFLNAGADAQIDAGYGDGLPLVAAARAGHLALVEVLLAKGCDPLQSSRKSESLENETNLGPNAIEGACFGGQRPASLNVLRVLLESIEDPKEREKACLRVIHKLSPAQTNRRVLEELLTQVPPDPVALGLACQYGSVRAVQRILSHGIDINTTAAADQMPLQIAIDYEYWELAQFLMANGAKLDATQQEAQPSELYRVAASIIESYAFGKLNEQKNFDRCEALLGKLLESARKSHVMPPKPVEFVDRLLIMACYVGSTQITTQMLELGALLDPPADLTRKFPHYPPSPLMAAVKENHPSVVRILLQHDTDPERIGGIPISSFGTVLRACLRKQNSILLRTFLECTNSIEITPPQLVFAARKWRRWREPEDPGLQIILEHRPDLAVPEEVLIALLSIESNPAACRESLYRIHRFMLSRSDCGVTAKMLHVVSSRVAWKALRDHHQEQQETGYLDPGRDTSDHVRTHHCQKAKALEAEFQTALQRIEESESEESESEESESEELTRSGFLSKRRTSWSASSEEGSFV